YRYCTIPDASTPPHAPPNAAPIMAACFAVMEHSLLGRGCFCGFESGCDGGCQFSSGSPTPVVEEYRARFVGDHVVVDCDDADPGFAEGFQSASQLVGEDDKVAVHDGIIVAAGECRPGIDAHFFTGLAPAGHFDTSTEHGF